MDERMEWRMEAGTGIDESGSATCVNAKIIKGSVHTNH